VLNFSLVINIIYACVAAGYVKANTEGVQWQTVRFWATHPAWRSLGKSQLHLFQHSCSSFV